MLPPEVGAYYLPRLGESVRDWHRRKPRPQKVAQEIRFHRLRTLAALESGSEGICTIKFVARPKPKSFPEGKTADLTASR